MGAFAPEGKAVIVTGASSGMGEAAALAFACEGAQRVPAAWREHEREQVAEAADSVLFLASDRSNFYSGQGLIIDGGYTVM